MKKKVIVVGGGLAGLFATIKLGEKKIPVDLFSMVACKRSHSACAQGGINASVNTKGEGDSPRIHFEETIHGGDYLANQPVVMGMCEKAPSYIYLLDRMGVAFNRTSDGDLEFRRFGGTKFHRTAFAGTTTGQQMLYSLDEQVRRLETEGLVRRFEGWEFLSAVIDEEPTVHGIVAIHLTNLEIRSFRADSVVIATGGPGMIFGRSTNSMICTGSAAGSLFQQGVWYANGEFIQVHPTAIPGEDKHRLISEAVRGEGGRIWTYKDGKRWYFLEEWYPKLGNLVPRDIASRAIFKVCREMKLGIDGQDAVYLDISHVPRKVLEERLAGILEIYEKFIGEDPSKVPMRVFPAVHYSMGGIYVDTRQMTNVAGLLACGECDYQYHGANRLGANSLLSCLYGAELAAERVQEYFEGLSENPTSSPVIGFEQQRKLEEEKLEMVLRSHGKENPYVLWDQMGQWMTDHVTVIRVNDRLKRTDEKLLELKERLTRVNVNDPTRWANQAVIFTRQLQNMIELARVITLGALRRNESRGAHYKPEFPERDDSRWLKTSVAKATSDGPEFFDEAVDTSLIQPKERTY